MQYPKTLSCTFNGIPRPTVEWNYINYINVHNGTTDNIGYHDIKSNLIVNSAQCIGIYTIKCVGNVSRYTAHNTFSVNAGTSSVNIYTVIDFFLFKIGP